MTEPEWLICADPGRMRAFLRGRISERKLGLASPSLALRLELGRMVLRRMRGKRKREPAMESLVNVQWAAMLRDVAGPFPFRAFSADRFFCKDPRVVALAERIYDEEAFDRMPELALALKESGCRNQEVLDHVGSPGPHIRGCWVIDLILGKT
jgi:hypothetical protein